MDLDQIKQLIEHVEKGRLRKFVLKRGDFEIQLEKESEHAVAVSHLPPSYHPARMPEHPIERHGDAALREPKTHQKVEAEGKFVSSPMVGTFYTSQSPDLPSFVKVGDAINENSVVCIIEAMKVMNEVKAGISGTVAEILVDNAHPVEFGTKLLRVI